MRESLLFILIISFNFNQNCSKFKITHNIKFYQNLCSRIVIWFCLNKALIHHDPTNYTFMYHCSVETNIFFVQILFVLLELTKSNIEYIVWIMENYSNNIYRFLCFIWLSLQASFISLVVKLLLQQYLEISFVLFETDYTCGDALTESFITKGSFQ